MTFKAPITIASAVLALSPTLAPADMILGSWNVRQLGWDNGKEVEKVAHVAQSMDLIALQELMDESALEELVAFLQLDAFVGELGDADLRPLQVAQQCDKAAMTGGDLADQFGPGTVLVGAAV